MKRLPTKGSLRPFCKMILVKKRFKEGFFCSSLYFVRVLLKISTRQLYKTSELKYIYQLVKSLPAMIKLVDGLFLRPKWSEHNLLKH